MRCVNSGLCRVRESDCDTGCNKVFVIFRITIVFDQIRICVSQIQTLIDTQLNCLNEKHLYRCFI